MMSQQSNYNRCGQCGTYTSNGNTVCKKCGSSLSVSNSCAPGIICPRCLSKNYNGSFFCYSCGKYFAEMENAAARTTSGNGRKKSAARRVRIAKIIMPNGNEITLSGDPVYIERSDFDGSFSREILMRVSRQHVLFSYCRGRHYVKDFGHDGKGSTNHTRLNGVDIFAKKRKSLKDGDTIELAGQPELTIKFKLVED